MAGTDYDSSLYCNFSSGSASATSGADWVLCVFSTGSTLLAVSGQQSLKISRSSDSIDVSSKDIEGGWKASITGLKEWSIDVEGVYVASDAAHVALTKAFNDGDLVCLKIMDKATCKPIMGGLAVITDYSVDANYDDKVGYSMSFQGNGALTDLANLESSQASLVTAKPSGWTASE